jgi:hypothetical protein
MPPRKKVEVVEEPLEAQPPAGIVLEDSFVGEATDSEMARLVEAARKAALEDEFNEDDVEDDVSVEAPVASASVQVKRGDFVSYVLGRDIIEDLKAKGVSVTALALGDTAPALVINAHVDGQADLRVFVDAEDVPVRRLVRQIPVPSEVTLDHVNTFFANKGRKLS